MKKMYYKNREYIFYIKINNACSLIIDNEQFHSPNKNQMLNFW